MSSTSSSFGGPSAKKVTKKYAHCMIVELYHQHTCRTTIKNGVKKTEVYENDKLVHHSQEAAPDTLTNRGGGNGHFIKYKY